MTKKLNLYVKGVKLLIDPKSCKPHSARLIITKNCMFKCKMCTFWKEKHKDPSLKLVKYWIKELAKFGIKDVDIGGGEPFIRKDLVEIVDEIKKYGMESAMTTNGWLVGKVPFPKLDRIEFSLDGAKPETHDEIRGIKGSFNQIMKAIPIAKKHCKVNRLNFVLQPDNYHEVVDFCKLCKRLGIPASIIPVSLKLSAQDKLSDDLNDFDVPKLKSLIKEAYAVGNLITNRHFIDIFISKIENGPKSQPCMSPYNCILIFANGDLYPCGNLDDSLGNLNFKTKLDDLYKKSEGLRKKILEGKHERCSRCIYPDIITRGTLRSSLKQRLGTYKK